MHAPLIDEQSADVHEDILLLPGRQHDLLIWWRTAGHMTGRSLAFRGK
jgi:hypothetical protein